VARGGHRIKYKSIEFSISCISGSLKRQNLRHSQSSRPLQGESPHFYALLAPFGLEIVNIEEVVKIRRIIIDSNRIGLYNLPGIIIDCNWLGLSTTLISHAAERTGLFACKI
jgi:hypothetical protein